MGDTQLMADSCVALLQLLFGENNWYRWNNIKQRSEITSLQTFLSWLLDVAERELKTDEVDGGYEQVVVDNMESDARGYQIQAEEAAGVDYQYKSEEGYQEQGASVKQEATEPGPAAAGRAEVVDESGGGGGVLEYQRELTGGELSQHVGIVYMTDSSAFYCDACRVTLSDIDMVTQHLMRRHPAALAGPGRTNISCFCCNQKFSGVAEYVASHRHLVTPKGKRKKQKRNTAAARSSATICQRQSQQHVCVACGKAFRSNQRLVEHVEQKHEQRGPRHECQDCHRKFTRSDVLYKHRKKCSSIQSQQLDNEVMDDLLVGCGQQDGLAG